MEASLAFQAGKPFLSDEEYDELKQKLQKKNSKVVQQVWLLLTSLPPLVECPINNFNIVFHHRR